MELLETALQPDLLPQPRGRQQAICQTARWMPRTRLQPQIVPQDLEECAILAHTRRGHCLPLITGFAWVCDPPVATDLTTPRRTRELPRRPREWVKTRLKPWSWSQWEFCGGGTFGQRRLRNRPDQSSVRLCRGTCSGRTISAGRSQHHISKHAPSIEEPSPHSESERQSTNHLTRQGFSGLEICP